MQFPESWLREFCNPPLTHRSSWPTLLTMGGPGGRRAAPGGAAVHARSWSARSSKRCSTPNADRLRVCQVDAGQGDGAAATSSAARRTRASASRCRCALVGAELPPGEDGKPLRDQAGQAARRREPGHAVLGARTEAVATTTAACWSWPPMRRSAPTCASVLKLDDTLFTLKLTPNLAHALSVYGVAREAVGADRRAAAARPRFEAGASRRTTPALPVKVEAPDLCGRFSGRIVRGVEHQGARRRHWMVDRLARCGQRSVTALVDISNYVMFEYGRPSHIFDLDKIHGGLVVRWGRAGRDAEAAQRQHHRGRRAGRRDRRRQRGRIAGRHHGRRCHRGVRRHAQHLCRGRVLVARGDRRAARAASTSPPMPGTASSAASIPRRRSSTSSASPR